MKIIIPTYRRTDNQRTWEQIKHTAWSDQVVAVCDAQDAVHLEDQGLPVVLVPDTVKTIADKRAWIIETWPQKKICMFDDDLRFFNRIGPHSPKLKPADTNSMDHMLRTICELLDEYAHVGVSPRGGNNRLDVPMVSNTRMMYVLGYQTGILLRHCELGRIQHREDFDYTLQLLKKGYQNRVLSHWACDNVYNEAGGASEERTIEASNADAYKLAELHPGFVTPRKKNYKVSIPRVEVTCYWKKAYESSDQHGA